MKTINQEIGARFRTHRFSLSGKSLLVRLFAHFSNVFSRMAVLGIMTFMIGLFFSLPTDASTLFFVGQALGCPEGANCADKSSLSPLVGANVGFKFIANENAENNVFLSAKTMNSGFFAVYTNNAPAGELYDEAKLTLIYAQGGNVPPLKFGGLVELKLYEDGVTPLISALFPQSSAEVALSVLSAIAHVDIPVLTSLDFVAQGGGGVIVARPIPEPSTLLMFSIGLAGLGTAQIKIRKT